MFWDFLFGAGFTGSIPARFYRIYRPVAANHGPPLSGRRQVFTQNTKNWGSKPKQNATFDKLREDLYLLLNKKLIGWDS